MNECLRCFIIALFMIDVRAKLTRAGDKKETTEFLWVFMA